MKLLFTKTKWPQSLGLRGASWEGEGRGRPGEGQEMLSALRKFWQAAFHSEQELQKVYSTTLHPSHHAAIFPSGLIQNVIQ